jgi:hypothetical protein
LVLQTAISIATDQRNPESWRSRESEIDEHLKKMKSKCSLFKEQLMTVYLFLAEVQVETGRGPVQIGSHMGESAHWAATTIFEMVNEAWKSCKATSERSRTDYRYTHFEPASRLFFDVWVKQLPSPNTVGAFMRHEVAAARKYLAKVSIEKPVPVPPVEVPAPTPKAQPITQPEETKKSVERPPDWSLPISKSAIQAVLDLTPEEWTNLFSDWIGRNAVKPATTRSENAKTAKIICVDLGAIPANYAMKIRDYKPVSEINS